MNCPLCGSRFVSSIGNIPESDEFAGVALSYTFYAELMHCKNCKSFFKSPQLSESDYEELYRDAQQDVWEGNIVERNDMKVVSSIIKSEKCNDKDEIIKVLDVGCSSGSFLNSLENSLEKFGIEPSIKAANAAKEKNINILSSNIYELNIDCKFDFITVIDVIEHIKKIDDFLDATMSHLNKSGTLIISTGNPNCLAWIFFKSKFWYSSFPEHLSFPSIKYYQDYCLKRGFSIKDYKKIKYVERPLIISTLFKIRQLVFFISPYIYRECEIILRKFLGKKLPSSRLFGVGFAGGFSDHHVIVIKK